MAGVRVNKGLLYVLCLTTLMTHARCDYNTSFAWLPSQWSSCAHKQPGTCCSCFQTRNIACVYSSTNQIVPPFYCHKSGTPRPFDNQSCAPCQQNCVLTSWSEWSPCSDTCSPGTRHRTRSVILPPQDGGAICGPLVELKECDDPNLPLCNFADQSPQYEWSVAEWSSCRKLTNDSTCGDGTRNRVVSCVRKDGHLVANDYCLYYLHGVEPISDELCMIPCDCVVSPWSEWGPCSRTCRKGVGSYHGYQARTRAMIREAEAGGATCPGLMDTKPCDIATVPRCPRYVWHHSDWGVCAHTELMADASAVTACGPGVQTRDVYCMSDGDTSYQPVADVLCGQDTIRWANDSRPFKPPERRACQVSCPRDCTLGEWENWSSCTQTCGTGGVRIRTRPVVEKKTEGGLDCGQNGRYEERLCESTPCNWWHTGQWSACSLETLYGQRCGRASQIRSVYCLNALDEVKEDEHCHGDGPKPITKQDCWVPCPGECAVSDWSDWTDCSATCGVKGGMQSRSRTVVDPGKNITILCPLKDELEQTRVCNQVPCKVYLWQVQGWSGCQQTNDTETCGPGSATGIQTRELLCQMDPGYPVDATHCKHDDRPTTTRVCDAPCPQHCKLSAWGDWSKCSQACGSDNLKVKFRVVLRWPLFGGKACPGHPDENGIIMKKKLCTRKSIQCGSVEWAAVDWSVCEVKGQGYGPACGKGLQMRNVSCTRTTDVTREVNNGMCYEEGLGAPPDGARACHIKCAGDCRLSDWSEFSPCSQTCGETAGVRTRGRYVINWDPSRSLGAQCPGLTDVELVGNVPCNMTPCPTYSWATGDWGSCLPHSDEETTKPGCGKGTQTRHVLCVQEDRVYVPDHRCDIVSAMPRRQQPCHVTCPVDCEVSRWSNWSNCSHICGNGLQHRERKVVYEPANGGRKCPRLLEMTTCFLQECLHLDWQLGEWGDCVPNWGMHCGVGVQSRSVECPAGTHQEAQCEARVRKPPTQANCFVPCMGDCVMSEWSEFSECDCQVQKAVRTRTRQIVQEALSSAVQCGPITDVELCRCPMYQLVIGGWTNCQAFESANQHKECGSGIEKRPVNCLDEAGTIVHLSMCVLGNLTLSRSCDVACPADCAVTGYTPWTECTQPCGVKATKTRSSSIMEVGNILGRPCPPSDQLLQVQACNSVPCYNYTWYRGEWYGCREADSGHCGVSRESRVVQCYRSDGMVVQDVYCLLEGESVMTSLGEMTQKEAADLDLDTERSCGTPCPGDCVLTEWTEYGPCIHNCSHGNQYGVQSRSRAIIRPALGGAPCPLDLIQTRSCPTENAICPVFAWETGDWNDHNRRRVHCVLNGDLVVYGGCILEEQPSRHRDCRDTCGVFAECLEGTCSCEPGFSGDGLLCLPEFGCATDDHCFLNNTYCDLMNKECLCWDQTLPDTGLLCLPHVGAVGNTDPLEELNQLFIYILIGCLIALLLLGIVTIVCMISHRKRRTKRSGTVVDANKLKKINNLDTKQKNNDQKMEPLYIARISDVDGDKDMTRSLHNVPYMHPYPSTLTHASSENDTGKGDSESSTEGSPPPLPSRLDRNLGNIHLDLDDDLFDTNEEDMVRQPFLPLHHSPRRPGAMHHQDGYDSNSLPSPRPSPLHPDAVLRVPSSRSVQPSSDSDAGSRLSTFRPDDSFSKSVPSTDSDLTTIWIPPNDLSTPDRRENRFPVHDENNPNIQRENPPYDRNLTRTPPDMYENLSSPEGTPEPECPPLPPPRISRGPPPPVAPKPSTKTINAAKGSQPACRPISRRHNTEPVPAQYRNGMVFGRGDGDSPETATLSPQRSLAEGPEASRDLKDMRGKSDSNMAAQTQDLLQYCDELLADLQRVANS